MSSEKEKEVTVVRVTRKEFELSNGEVHLHPIELDDTPTLSEFKHLNIPLVQRELKPVEKV